MRRRAGPGWRPKDTAVKHGDCTNLPTKPSLFQDVSPPWRTVREAETVAPYAVRGNQWIGYDDQTSVRQKVEIRFWGENIIVTTMCLWFFTKCINGRTWDCETSSVCFLCSGVTSKHNLWIDESIWHHYLVNWKKFGLTLLAIFSYGLSFSC